MGLVSGLLLLPVTGPLRAFRLLLEHLHDEAEATLRDEGRAFAELIELSMRHNAGQLSEAEYAEQEEALLARLEAMREYREELLAAGRAGPAGVEAYAADEHETYDAGDGEEEEAP